MGQAYQHRAIVGNIGLRSVRRRRPSMEQQSNTSNGPGQGAW